MKLQGIFPPIATPFDANGDLYPAKVRHNVEKWNLTALSGYVVCGSTGESVMLNTEEKLQLWGLVAEYAAPEKLLLAGTGVVIGVFVAYLAARAMSALLAGVEPGDPLTLSAAAVLCLLTAILGCVRPALRASRVDPITALRSD